LSKVNGMKILQIATGETKIPQGKAGGPEGHAKDIWRPQLYLIATREHDRGRLDRNTILACPQ